MQINLIYLRFNLKKIKILSLLYLFTATSILAISQKIELINPTFLGNERRNYYGNKAPDTLKLIWKHYLGEGKTTISKNIEDQIWAGAGWT